MPNVPAGGQMSITQSLADCLGSGAFFFVSLKVSLFRDENQNEPRALEMASERHSTRKLGFLQSQIPITAEKRIEPFMIRPGPFQQQPSTTSRAEAALSLRCLSEALRSEREKRYPRCLKSTSRSSEEKQRKWSGQ